MLKNILTIAKIFTKYARTNPGFYILGVIIFPLSLLIPLFILSGQLYKIDIFIGSAVCATTIMTISDISDIISNDKYVNSLSFFVTRPVMPYQYIFGVGLSTLVYNIIGLTIILLFGMFFLKISINLFRIILIFLLIFIGWFISASIGFIMGMWGPRDPRANTSLASILAYFLTFLAPIYYPITSLPDILQKISYIFYTTHLSIMGKNLLRGEAFSWLNLTIIFIYLFFNLLLITKVIKWKNF